MSVESEKNSVYANFPLVPTWCHLVDIRETKECTRDMLGPMVACDQRRTNLTETEFSWDGGKRVMGEIEYIKLYKRLCIEQKTKGCSQAMDHTGE